MLARVRARSGRLVSPAVLAVLAACGGGATEPPSGGAAPPPGALDAGPPQVAAADAGTPPPPRPDPDGAAPCTAADILGRLACIPGMTVEETTADDGGQRPVPAGYRRFELTFAQPVDHASPSGPVLKQRLELLHASETAPMVLASSGYGLSRGRTELTRLFGANQLQVEHRFFSPSAPDAPAWDKLTIRQAAEDYHRLVSALRPIYTGKWVNTGASKGGMTSVYHRRFYPQDVDATVAYVAPNVYGLEDARFPAFVSAVGGPEYEACRAKIVAFQRTILTRRDEITPRMQGSYARLGGKDVALEHAVLELPFVFWQYGDPDSRQTGCSAIPASDAPIATVYRFFATATQLSNYADSAMAYFEPYFYQAATQIGGPAVDDAPLAALLRHRATYTPVTYAPAAAGVPFDVAAMEDIATWVKTSGRTLLFLYGERDPWTAGAFELGAAVDSFVYVAPKDNHGANLASLAPSDRAAALGTLERWLGARVVPSTPSASLRADAAARLRSLEEDALVVRRPRL